VTLFAGPVKTLAPIGFGLHDERGSLLMLMSPVKGLPPVVPRLAVLRARRKASDVYVVPEKQGGVALAMVPGGMIDFVRTLSHDLVWLSLAQDSEGTIAIGLFADEVKNVEVDGKAATLGRNGFLYEARGRKAKQIDALLVTTKDGRRLRMPLDRKEFRS
jgi:hypothetical protein